MYGGFLILSLSSNWFFELVHKCIIAERFHAARSLKILSVHVLIWSSHFISNCQESLRVSIVLERALSLETKNNNNCLSSKHICQDTRIWNVSEISFYMVWGGFQFIFNRHSPLWNVSSFWLASAWWEAVWQMHSHVCCLLLCFARESTYFPPMF